MRALFALLLSIFFLFGCHEKEAKRADTALDTGRDFIRASLDGDFEKAESLLLPDKENKQLFDSYHEFYNKMPEEKKEGYKHASYEIHQIQETNDSTTLINYSNSFMQKSMEIKIIRQSGNWWVDFKHTSTEINPENK
jgi:hypothetical protein